MGKLFEVTVRFNDGKEWVYPAVDRLNVQKDTYIFDVYQPKHGVAVLRMDHVESFALNGIWYHMDSIADNGRFIPYGIRHLDDDLELYLWTREDLLNKEIKSRGFISLNDVYAMFGFRRTESGDNMGWTHAEGDFSLNEDIADDRLPILLQLRPSKLGYLETC